MSSKAVEISSIIREQIKQYESKIEMKENGTVITVGDGGSASVEELARRGACVLPDEENQRDEEVESDDSNL